MWIVETIGDNYSLYIRIHINFISSKDGNPQAGAFKNTPKEGDNLSSDWSKYCTPDSSLELIGKQKKKDGSFKNPKLFYIWEMNVGKIRNRINPSQKVNHDPIYNNPELDGHPNNRAHSIIIGEKPNNAEFRVNLLKVGDWVLKD